MEPRDPVKEKLGRGTGMGTLTPTWPTSTSMVNLRAAAPLRVFDAKPILPLPPLVADGEGTIEPRRLIYAETPSAAICTGSVSV